MPLINKKLFFIHIPKTSGTSLYANLAKNNVPVENFITSCNISSHHYHIDIIPQEYLNYKRFTILRDPWDRTISAYCYRNKKQNIIDIDHFNKWLYITFVKFKKNRSVWDNHFRTQSEFIDSKTKIFLFNDISSCHNWLCTELGIVNNFTEHRLKNHISYTKINPKDCDVYNDWKDIYKRDIELYERVYTEQNS